MVMPLEDGLLHWRENEEFSLRLKSFGIGEIRDRIDSYLLWMINSGSIGDEEEWFPLLIQLRSSGAAKDLMGIYGPQAEEQVVLLADWWCNEPNDDRYLSVWVRKEFFALLGNPDSRLAQLVDRIEFGRTFFDSRVGARPTRDSSAPREGRQATASGTQRDRAECANHSSSSPALKRSGPPVVVGIVDDGIAFAHSHFLSGDGVTTRMHAFWDQRDPVPITGSGGSSGTPVPYGIELRRHDINQLLNRHRHAGLVDEDALYAEVGQRQVLQRVRHGTHVLDVAAGSGPGESSDAVIVAVQLPATIAADSSGANLAPYLLDAVRYIVARADELAASLNDKAPGEPAQLQFPPVVINLSYGLMGGPHDGSSLLELALADLVARREGRLSLAPPQSGVTGGANLNPGKAPLAIVIAAGNSALERCHAQFDLPAQGTQQLKWRIPPDCRTTSYLEIWIPQGADVTVTVQPPAAFPNLKGSVKRLAPPVHLLQPGQGALTSRLLASLSFVPGSGSSAGSSKPQAGSYGVNDMVLVAVAPTEGLDLGRAWAPPGVWTVEVLNSGTSLLSVHAWIRRNDSPFGWRTGGRQSRFEDAAYQIFDDHGRLQEEDPSSPPSHILRKTTLNGIATGENVFVVGALRADTGKPTPYSAHGPALAGPGGARQGPEVSAPADRSPARPGVAGAGTRSGGSAVFLNGTSVAAPAVVRRLAEEFSKNSGIGSAQAFFNVVDRSNPPMPHRSGRNLKKPVVTTRDDPP